MFTVDRTLVWWQINEYVLLLRRYDIRMCPEPSIVGFECFINSNAELTLAHSMK